MSLGMMRGSRGSGRSTTTRVGLLFSVKIEQGSGTDINPGGIIVLSSSSGHLTSTHQLYCLSSLSVSAQHFITKGTTARH